MTGEDSRTQDRWPTVLSESAQFGPQLHGLCMKMHWRVSAHRMQPPEIGSRMSGLFGTGLRWASTKTTTITVQSHDSENDISGADPMKVIEQVVMKPETALQLGITTRFCVNPID